LKQSSLIRLTIQNLKTFLRRSVQASLFFLKTEVQGICFLVHDANCAIVGPKFIEKPWFGNLPTYLFSFASLTPSNADNISVV